jgi:hypothetical protein
VAAWPVVLLPGAVLQGAVLRAMPGRYCVLPRPARDGGINLTTTQLAVEGTQPSAIEIGRHKIAKSYYGRQIVVAGTGTD